MLCKLDKFLNSLYRYSGYVASFFLILILVSIVIGITSRIFGFYIRGLTEYSGYSLATASFLALAYTFNENGHIRITLFLEKAKKPEKKVETAKDQMVKNLNNFPLAFSRNKVILI